MAYDEDTKVFDVSKPNKFTPSSTSKPVIVGHHPTMDDPMVKKDENAHTGSTEHAKDDNNNELKSTPIHISMDHDEEAHKVDLASPSEPDEPSIGTGPADNIDFSSLAANEEKEEVGEITQPIHASEFPELPDHPEHDEMPKKDKPAKDDSKGFGYTSLNSLIHPNDDKPKEEKKAEKGGGDTSDTPKWSGTTPPLHIPQGAGPRRKWSKVIKWLILVLLILFVVAYLAIDLGLIKSNIKLPFHIFGKHETSHTETTPPPAPAANNKSADSMTNSSVPAGFTEYKLEDTGVSFAYPTAWGAPAVTNDPGFSKRGGTNKSDGVYAHLIKFATNKDIEIAVSSSKYLPAKRDALYYDFLQWCTGTNDGKFYKENLRFTTTGGVDTPSTIVCDQGPMEDATKLDDHTLQQLKTKDAKGVELGDLYTKNLSDENFTVLRVKDAAMKNGEEIKKLLGTVKVSSSADSPTGSMH